MKWDLAPSQRIRRDYISPCSLIEATPGASLVWAHFSGYGIAAPIQAADSSHSIVVPEIHLYYVFHFPNHW